MFKFPRRLIPALIVLAVLVALYFGFQYLTRPKPVLVVAGAAQTGRVETTVANTRAGSIAACRRAKIAPSASGEIVQLPIKKGQRVKTDQLLLEIWNKDLVAREQVAREQSRSAAAHATEACQLAIAAESEARQSRALFNKGFVSEEAVIRAEAQGHSSDATCAASRAAAKQAEAGIGAAHADLLRTILRAPFDGIIAEINGELGEFVTPSPPGIMTLPVVDLIDDSCLYVTAPIDEVDAANLKVGMTGRITLDAYRGRHFPGHVRRIAPYVLEVEKQARTVEVEVEFEQPQATLKEGNLLVGYSADIEVVTATHENVLRIPTSALMPGNKVLAVEDGKLAEHKVDIGLSNWEYTEITGGLQAGDKVVTSLDRDGVKAGARADIEASPAARP